MILTLKPECHIYNFLFAIVSRCTYVPMNLNLDPTLRRGLEVLLELKVLMINIFPFSLQEKKNSNYIDHNHII